MNICKIQPVWKSRVKRCVFRFILMAEMIFNFYSVVYSQPGISVSGIVVDAETGESLPGANILLLPGTTGTASDLLGRFQLAGIVPGEYRIRVQFMGFQTWEKSLVLSAGAKMHLQIALKPSPLAFPEISVSAERDAQIREVGLSRQNIDLPEMRRTASLSEPDLFRTIALLPGIAPTNDYNTRLYVRGGRSNENQVLIDGVTIHNPFHAFGFMSIFNVDAIKQVEMYRGIFPARYNQSLSSVTNVILRDGNARKLSGTAMISPISAKFFLEGPLLKYNSQTGKKWTFMVNGRRTYLDFAPKVYEILPFYFYDVSFKSVFDSGNRTRIIVHGFQGLDRIKPSIENGSTDTFWKNRAGGIQWSHFINPQNVFDLIFSYSDFHTSVQNSQSSDWNVTTNQRQLNEINEISARAEWNREWRPALHSTAGYHFSRFAIDEFMESVYLEIYQGEWRKNDHHAAYLNLEGQMGNLVLFEAGISGLYFSYPDKFAFAPRLGLKWLLTDRWRVKAGVSRHFQALTTINDDDDSVVLFDAWIPSPKNRPVPRADHFGLGVEYSRGTALSLNCEIYYRDYSGLTRINRSQMAGEPLFLDGRAESFGLDLGVNYHLRNFSGFLNYTWGQATSHFFLRNVPMRHLNDFRWQSFPSAGDIRHILNFSTTARLGSKWNFGLTCIFQTGRPFTANVGNFFFTLSAPPEPYYFEAGEWFFLGDGGNTRYLQGRSHYSPKNKYRFPFYQRVDVQFERNFRLFRLDGQIFLQVYNIFCRLNTAFHYTNSEVAYSLPILPTLGVQVRF
jgi:outer membrane cobalamin receptor